ncbi:MAG: prepilin-type N-terminal cleavage/methylation domain-containing protein [Oligoflexales bacterium]|nr:prepilin-type N-terminal cleavage/methylation domain-containing protein [Oligoflexales bacterium]
MSSKHHSGFTLLEVLVTLSILMSIVFAVSQVLKNSFDIRLALSRDSQVTRRLNVVLQSLNRDLSHAFLLSNKDSIRTGGRKRTIFQIEQQGESSILSMTYMGHKSLKADSKESDLSYVVYEVKESKKNPSRKNLYRGETPRVPENFKEKPQMQLLAEDIASVKLEYWNGDDWATDRWDSTQGDTANKLPHMVRITVRVWTQEALDREGSSGDKDDNMDQFSTAVYLPYALDFPELKQKSTSFRLR